MGGAHAISEPQFQIKSNALYCSDKSFIMPPIFTKFRCGILLLLLAASISNVTAQKNFQPVRLVQTNGDTIAGWIDYQKWILSPKTIEFQEQVNGPSRILTPMQVAAFFVGGEWYGGRIVLRSNSPNQLKELDAETRPQLVADTLFLRAIVLGKANLWVAVDADRREQFFLEKEDLPIELLVFKRYYGKDANGNTGVLMNQRFRGQLAYYLSECPQAAGLSRNATYKGFSLRKIVRAYNNCFPGGNRYVKTKEKVRLETSVAIGISRFTLDLSTSPEKSLQDANFSPSTQLTGGLNLNIVFPRSLGRFALYNSLLYETYKTSAQTRTYPMGIAGYVDRSLNFKDLNLRLFTLFRYQSPTRRIKPFFCAGFSQTFSLNSKHADRLDTYFGGSVSTRTGSLDRNESFILVERAFVLGTGIKYQRFQVEIRGGFANGRQSTYTESHHETTGLYLLGSYQL